MLFLKRRGQVLANRKNAADGIKGRLRGSAGKSTDAETQRILQLKRHQTCIKIKYVDRKYWMLHKDDDKMVPLHPT